MDTYCCAVFATLVIGVCHGLEASQAAKAAPVATALNACTRPHSNHYIWQDWNPMQTTITGCVQFNAFFPTCQVRVVRFYQSACPPPPPPPPPRLAVLLALLLASASSTSTSALLHLHFRLANLANSSPSSSPTSQLSAHRWTSTGDLPSSVCTAGPQPGTCPAQCAPLDINRGPSQLSVHRWTST